MIVEKAFVLELAEDTEADINKQRLPISNLTVTSYQAHNYATYIYI
jgi:hypothetical protein